jgi:hypothetical protein
MPARDPSVRALTARIAANTRWSREDPHDPAGPLPRARAAFNARFEREVDPERVLPEAERARRAECARKVYYQRLALRSVQARRHRAATRRSDGAA